MIGDCGLRVDVGVGWHEHQGTLPALSYLTHLLIAHLALLTLLEEVGLLALEEGLLLDWRGGGVNEGQCSCFKVFGFKFIIINIIFPILLRFTFLTIIPSFTPLLTILFLYLMIITLLIVLLLLKRFLFLKLILNLRVLLYCLGFEVHQDWLLHFVQLPRNFIIAAMLLNFRLSGNFF